MLRKAGIITTGDEAETTHSSGVVWENVNKLGIHPKADQP